MDAHAEAIVDGVHLEHLVAGVRIDKAHVDAWEEMMMQQGKLIKTLTIAQHFSFLLPIRVPARIAHVDIQAVAPTPAILRDEMTFSLSRSTDAVCVNKREISCCQYAVPCQ